VVPGLHFVVFFVPGENPRPMKNKWEAPPCACISGKLLNDQSAWLAVSGPCFKTSQNQTVGGEFLKIPG
jgi:hypothetical protein